LPRALVAGVSVADVARKHAISTSQLYAWPQRLLRESLRAAPDITQNGCDAM
jgi:transposase-like protein